jgi:DNA-binding beta-propeller fold protein YncE
MKRACSALGLLVLLWTALAFGQTVGAGYHIIDSIQVGGDGGWDYLIVDSDAQRAYLSHATCVTVVDLAKHAVAGEIPNTPGVHGIALVPARGKGYTSNGRDSSVTVFDPATLTTLARIKIQARNPDAILYDPSSDRLFTFNGGSASATAIDTKSDTVLGTISLPGKPEFAVTDLKGTIYVNIEDKSLVVGFDARTLKVLSTWSIAPGDEPSGLAIDREHGRLLSVCGNKLMVVLDMASGKVIATVPTGEGTDGAAFDPGPHIAFSSNGEGTLTVVREDAPEKYSSAGNIPTRRGARTVTVDPKTHRVYTVSARFGPAPAPTPERPRPRPPVEPGSFTLYVIGR